VSALPNVFLIGYGRFGRALGMLLQEAGVAFQAYDPAVEVPERWRVANLETGVRGAGLIVLAVPVPMMAGVLAEIVPWLQAPQWVVDVGSVKTIPSQLMQETMGTRIPWVASHPLFGPASLARGERPLRVVVCPQPLFPEAHAATLQLYRTLGCEVIEQDAETHDRAMANTHALAFLIAKGLVDIGIDDAVAVAPPSFQAILKTVEAVRSDAGHLFMAIQSQNPYAASARKRFLQSIENIDRRLDENAQPNVIVPEKMNIPEGIEIAPDLRETRELIDELDKEMVQLLARRLQLSKRAGLAKAKQGKAIRDPEREQQLLAERGKWAKDIGIDEQDICGIFELVLRFSRKAQSL
jgi:prephenate dehydrogenase